MLAEQPEAAVIHEAAFYGTWPQLLGAPGIRPRRTVGLGIFPLTLRGTELTMMGPPPPRAGLDVRGAAAAFNAELAAQLTGATAHAQHVMAGLGASAALPVISDAQILLPDVFAQLTVPSFEYPRIGALPPEPPTAWQPPSWWPELSQRRVVALTQGTVANHDLTDLVQPTLAALADEDVLVVAGLGGRKIAPGDLHVLSNARVESFIPFDALFPLADVVATNGGYGGAQLALHHGVPLVVVGGSEDKPAVAARVAHFGFGVELRTG
ncbi:nucleotide disphospho-sugar-binding domain-containing protein [Streptomyces sp. NPDC048663]|uniref:glycosyltransferase n=1 Tax=Streptomyces sp. NPDC048663 TaxID=3155638 RepID=UPI0034439626